MALTPKLGFQKGKRIFHPGPRTQDIQDSTTSLSRIGLLGGRGVAPQKFQLESSYLCYLGAHAKIQNSTTSLSRIYLKLADFPVKIGLNGGLEGGPQIVFCLESYYLCYLGAHTKILNPVISLSGINLKIAHIPVKRGLIGA